MSERVLYGGSREFVDRVLKCRSDVKAIVLYGSFARGEEKPFPI